MALTCAGRLRDITMPSLLERAVGPMQALYEAQRLVMCASGAANAPPKLIHVDEEGGQILNHFMLMFILALGVSNENGTCILSLGLWPAAY